MKKITTDPAKRTGELREKVWSTVDEIICIADGRPQSVSDITDRILPLVEAAKNLSYDPEDDEWCGICGKETGNCDSYGSERRCAALRAALANFFCQSGEGE